MAHDLLGDRLWLTDSGLETTLVFHDGLELPCFAAFDLLRTAAGRARLEAYYLRHLAIALGTGSGFVLESPTWRANPDWADRLGHGKAALAALNRAGVALMRRIRDGYADADVPMLVSGCIGPRGDGYVAGDLMRPEAAQAYHAEQVATLHAAGADVISAMTSTNVPEAIGIARAVESTGRPCVISFTVETDGRLPAGDALGDAIAAVDAAAPVAWFGINCAHPSHFLGALAGGPRWVSRIGAVRANASRQSHAELDAATVLDDGDPPALALDYARLRALLPGLRVLGGCCGTDHRHVEAIGRACIG